MSAFICLLLAAAPIQLEPPSLTFGPAEASLELLAPDAAALVVSSPSSPGAVGDVRPVGPGRFRARFTFPLERFPQMVLLRVEVQSKAGVKSGHWLALSLLASTNLKIETKPGAKVTVTIGAASFGPAIADRQGKVTIAARVPPGFSIATVTALDRAGNKTTTPLELPSAPFARAAAVLPAGAASPDEEAQLEVFAIDPDGTPRLSPVGLSLSAQLGSCAAPVARGEGLFSVAYRAPKSVAADGDTVKLGFEGARESTLQIPLRAGQPARIEVGLAPAEYVAGSGARVTVTASVTDAHGNPVTGAASPTVAVDFGRVADGQLTVPDGFDGRTEVRIHASTAKLAGDAQLPLRPGPPFKAVLVLPGSVAAGDSMEGKLVLTDEFGNPVKAGAVGVVSSTGRAASLRPNPDGSYAVSYAAARDDPPGPLALEVRAGSRAMAREELSLLPYQRTWAVVVGAFVAGSWNLSQARAVNARLSLGLRLAQSPFEVAAEGAFGHYPLVEGARTGDGVNDGSITISAWWVALGLRYSIVLTSLWAVLLSVSGGAQLTNSTIAVVGGAPLLDSGWGPLVRGGAGVAVHALGGRVLLQVEYGYAPAPGDRVRGNLGGLGATLGYLASF